jgi:hypothetical protein
MHLHPTFLPQPPAHWEAETIACFERLFATTLEGSTGALIDYRLPVPKWQFLSYLCEHKNIVLHGSGKADIDTFEPRKANDVEAFGNRCAVYAASDGIWPIFFAIVARERNVTSLVNGCFRVVEASGRSGWHYYFSINGDALLHKPWRTGTIYLLPADTFEPQPRQRYRGMEIEIPQWASLVDVRALARLGVTPEDFPFLSHIHPHDPAIIRQRAQADPDGFPWHDA